MALDPAVVAVWQIIAGFVLCCVSFTITYYVHLRLQKNHPYYRYGEAMSVGYAKLQTIRIYQGLGETMPAEPSDVEKFADELSKVKTDELARKTQELERRKAALDKQAKELVPEPQS